MKKLLLIPFLLCFQLPSQALPVTRKTDFEDTAYTTALVLKYCEVKLKEKPTTDDFYIHLENSCDRLLNNYQDVFWAMQNAQSEAEYDIYSGQLVQLMVLITEFAN